MITSSDAHRLADIGTSSTRLFARRTSFDELRKALNVEDGRAIVVH